MKFRSLLSLLSVSAILLVAGCEKQPEPEPTPPTPPEKKELTPTSGDLLPTDVPDYDKIHMNSEFYKSSREGNVTSTFYDPLKSSSLYYFGRSRQSEHFIIFWDKDYGTAYPDEVASPYHLDTKAFLDWCEEIYKYYVNTLKFIHLNTGEKSYLDQYKFQIFLWHQTEWAAYGSGPQDNITGCLWVNPEAANSRATVAHEIGHSFQYQVACDLILNQKATDIWQTAFRYDQGNGSDFWEQTAQWMAYQMVPEETFTNYNFGEFCDNAHRHFAHEDMRYGSYFFHYYWVDKYGLDAVSKVWHTARKPKDSMESYMSTFSLTLDEFNAQVYDYAARVATWDFEQIKAEGARHAGAVTWKGVDAGAGWWKVDPSKAPEATGFNLIRLSVAPGQELTMDFAGMPNAAGYNKSGDAKQAGWTLGFVSGEISPPGNTAKARPRRPPPTTTARPDGPFRPMPNTCGRSSPARRRPISPICGMKTTPTTGTGLIRSNSRPTGKSWTWAHRPAAASMAEASAAASPGRFPGRPSQWM